MATTKTSAPDLDRQKLERFITASGVAFDSKQVHPELTCLLKACAGRAYLNRDTNTITCAECGCELDVFDAVLHLNGVADEMEARRIINRLCDGVADESVNQWGSKLQFDKEGNVMATDPNLYEIFLNHPDWAGALGRNVRSLEIVVLRDLPIDAKRGDVLGDHHGYQAAGWAWRELGIKSVKAVAASNAMIHAAHQNEFDPVKDWLETLVWDGAERLDLWLPHLVGCDETAYTRAVGSKTLISAVARVYEPGAKVDTVMLLCGPQGTLKSTLLRELAGRPEWFTDHVSDIGGKDAAMQLCGPWIMEFAELDAITSKREAERVKSWLTQTKDRFRPPYARNVIDVPRRVVFTGTSNLQQFLRDETGGRRFLPIEIREIDLDAVKKYREQLWAEARHRYLAGEKWWLEGDALAGAQEQQEDRRLADPWEAEVTRWIDDQARPLFLTAREVLTSGLKVDVSRQTKSDLDRVGRIFGSILGWTRGKRREKDRVISVWYPPPRDGEQKVIDLKTAPNDDEPQGRLGRDY